ncbi:MAG: helix-turn-helix domain-containing protein [Daejeonella sp.]|uniref:helix-turn-helix domain-containing protein n=1 Tax=Daejeonella sp. JGW-45 TaxID=3034148 RepID=UPI003204F7E2
MNFFNTYRPCNELGDIVELYWHSKCYLEQPLVQEMYTPTLQAMTFNLGGQSEDILSEEMSLRMDKDCYLIGQPLSKRVSVSSSFGIDILGVKFTTLGLYRLTGIDMKHISDKIISANDVWNYEIDLLHEEILDRQNIFERIKAIENFLRKKKAQQRFDEKTYLLHHSIQKMESDKIYDIHKLRQGVFTTKKTYERYFLNYIGVTPKQYANICRFNNVFKYLKTVSELPDWHDIVVKFGYYDQSHFIREFKRYSGKTPSEFYLQQSPVIAPEPIVALQQIFG